MIYFKDIFKIHNIDTKIILEKDGFEKIINLIEACTIAGLREGVSVGRNKNPSWQKTINDIYKQFSEIKEETKPQPEAWDELPKS